MDERINAGDLVVIVRWPCCHKLEGLLGTVSGFMSAAGRRPDCGFCHTLHLGVTTVVVLDGNMIAPLEWLKKIPPLSDLEATEHSEKVNA